jgi:hypothetical protein
MMTPTTGNHQFAHSPATHRPAYASGHRRGLAGERGFFLNILNMQVGP